MSKKWAGIDLSGFTTVIMSDDQKRLKFHERGDVCEGAFLPDINLELCGEDQIKALRDFLNDQLSSEQDQDGVKELIEAAQRAIEVIHILGNPISSPSYTYTTRLQTINDTLKSLYGAFQKLGIIIDVKA